MLTNLEKDAGEIGKRRGTGEERSSEKKGRG